MERDDPVLVEQARTYLNEGIWRSYDEIKSRWGAPVGIYLECPVLGWLPDAPDFDDSNFLESGLEEVDLTTLERTVITLIKPDVTTEVIDDAYLEGIDRQDMIKLIRRNTGRIAWGLRRLRGKY